MSPRPRIRYPYRSPRQIPTRRTDPLTPSPAKTAFIAPDTYRASAPSADLGLSTNPATENRYNYVNGDPVNNIDPTGHTSQQRCPDGCNSPEPPPGPGPGMQPAPASGIGFPDGTGAQVCSITNCAPPSNGEIAETYCAHRVWQPAVVFRCKSVKGEGQESFDLSDQYFGGHGGNGYADDFQHTMWAAFITMDHGPRDGTSFIDDHENVPLSQQPQDQRWMDLNNNAIGIAIGRYAKQNKIKHGDLAKTVYNRIMTSQQGQGFVLVFGTDVNPATKGQKVGGKY